MGGSEAQGDLEESSKTFRKERLLPRVLSYALAQAWLPVMMFKGTGVAQTDDPTFYGSGSPGVVCAPLVPGHESILYLLGEQLHSWSSSSVTESQTGWRVSFFSSNTCILFLAPSTGHPVPKPELIHLLEHGQKLWTGTRGLPHSTGPGRNW